MPDEKTHADSLRAYLTGAGSDGGAQADPDASIGNYRSSTRCEFLAATISNPIANVTLLFVAGENGEGAGSLAATGVNDLAWTPPGGSQGAAVTIANGETKILEGGGGEASKFVRVTRTSVADLSGAAMVTLAKVLNDVLGFDNIASAEALAGDDEYRCLALKNEAAGSVTNLKVWVKTLGTQQTSDAGQLGASGAGTISTTGSFADWPASGWAHLKTAAGATREIVYYSSRTATTLTVPAAGREALGTTADAGADDDTVDAVPGIRISKEAPTAQPDGHFDDPADESTEPAGPTWNTGTTAATGLQIGTLAAGEIAGVWLHREVPAGMAAAAVIENALAWSFDAS
jgi:hypothetical protein